MAGLSRIEHRRPSGGAAKSLFISRDYFPPQVGGISNLLAQTALSLGPSSVCCLTGVTSNQSSDDLGIHTYRRPGMFAKSSLKQGISVAKGVREIVIRERPTIAHIGTIDDGYLGLLLRRFLNLPFILCAHGNELLGNDTSWDKPNLAIRNAECVIAVSKFTAALVVDRGVDVNRIRVIYPGCDTEHFRPLSPNADLKDKILRGRSSNSIILTIGNLVERKGHDLVIRAMPELLKTVPDVTYLIVGDGPYRKRLEELTYEAAVADHVIFLGRVPSNQLPEFLAICDVFAMPSRPRLECSDVEGFGLVFLEANACGKPTIGGRSGGVAEAVLHDETGVLVDPTDFNDLGQQLSRLLLDKALARELGQRGRQRVQEHFTWSRVGQQTREVIHSIRARPWYTLISR